MYNNCILTALPLKIRQINIIITSTCFLRMIMRITWSIWNSGSSFVTDWEYNTHATSCFYSHCTFNMPVVHIKTPSPGSQENLFWLILLELSFLLLQWRKKNGNSNQIEQFIWNLSPKFRSIFVLQHYLSDKLSFEPFPTVHNQLSS